MNRLLLQSLKWLGIICTESTESPHLECVQSICFIENRTSKGGSPLLTINWPTLHSIQHPRLWFPLTSSFPVSSRQHSDNAHCPSEVNSSKRTGLMSPPWVCSKLQTRLPSLLENLPRCCLNESVNISRQREFYRPVHFKPPYLLQIGHLMEPTWRKQVLDD